VRRLTAHWGPAAGVAQQLLLHALAEGVLAPGGVPGSTASGVATDGRDAGEAGAPGRTRARM
jgi:hypothetical protein